MTRVLYGGKTREADAWRDAILALKPDLDLILDPVECDPASIDILLYAPSGPIQNLAPYAGAAAIQSLWAGVETILGNPTLPEHTPVLRMVEDGLTIGMTDYVVGHVLRAHLGVQRQQEDQQAGRWGEDGPPLSQDRRVGIVGLGALGRDAAEKLAALHFRVSGWSRSPKALTGVTCLSGTDGLQQLLGTSEILVLLVPLTPATNGLIGADALSRLPEGAHIINAARGPLIDEDALLEALDTGKIETATLDVFDTEPLPQGHPFWSHPRVLVTPHIASATRPPTAARTILEQVSRFEAGKPFLHIVDRERGY